MNEKMNLDVNSPDKVPLVLAFVIDKYRQDAADLRSAWQDGNAGSEWNRIANVLEKADAKIRQYLGDMGYNQFTDGK